MRIANVSLILDSRSAITHNIAFSIPPTLANSPSPVILTIFWTLCIMPLLNLQIRFENPAMALWLYYHN